MRQRDPGIGGYRDGRGDTGNDLERNSVRGQRFRFLAAAPEDERITALEPYHPEAAPGAIEQQRGYDLLFDALGAAVLADQQTLGVWRSVVEQTRVRQVVVDHDVGAPQAAHAIERDQPRRARSGANQVDG